MAETAEAKGRVDDHETRRDVEHVSRAQINGYPRDLLKRFKSSTQNHNHNRHNNSSDEDMELNLGLSLGGCFGVNPREGKNSRGLVRSSSIAGVTTLRRCDEDDDSGTGVPWLTRTTSLPMETEEEWRKRKELQSLRRMEAKRKRFEKQRQSRAGREGSNCENDDQKPQQQHVGVNGMAAVAVAPPQPFGLSSWAAALVRGMERNGNGIVCGNGLAAAAAAALRGGAAPSSQGSIGSQGSSSSGISEFESRSAQGMSSCAEVRSPSSVQSLSEQQQLIDQKPNAVAFSTGSIADQKSGTPTAARADVDSQSKKPKMIENGVRETGMRVMEEMPCVSTKGDGPNGKRIEGFLYRYRKGEEVRIVCVCHGNFLSPAEFVKHAGGGDVAHPMRHIVVNPSASFLS